MKTTRPWYAHPALHIAAIIVVAALFRLWRLESIPPGLFGDEATDGLDALDVLAGRGAVFFPANFGREGLHMWIVAGMFRVLGVVPLALRLPSVLAGILTAIATYWLGVELLAVWRGGADRRGEGTSPDHAARLRAGEPRPYETESRPSSPVEYPTAAAIWSFLPLVAALYLATSYWHVHFSRFGIRGVFTPLCGALAFAAFWRGVNRRSYVWFAIGGLCLGFATHFYTASRFFPFFLAGFLLVQWVVAALWSRDAPLLPRFFKGIALYYAVAALVFAPLGIYFVQHPGSFTQRASEVAAFSGVAASPWTRMVQAALANVLQFVVPGRGDLERFYNLPGRAVFDPLTAVFAVIGLLVLLWRWKRSPALFLLLWFPALLLPSFLATDRWPTLPRVLGVIPGVYFFPAVGLLFAAGLLARGLNRRGKIRAGVAVSSGLVMVALLVHAAATYRAYFATWGPAQATYDALEGDMTAAWRWLAENAAVESEPNRHVYLSSDIYRHPTFMLLHERATVQTYFEHANPGLSWFDARYALPLPPPGEPATYLISAPAMLAEPGNEVLFAVGRERDRILAPDGSAVVTIVEVPTSAGAASATPDTAPLMPFTERLSLTDASLTVSDGGAPELRLLWHTTGPEPGEWAGYRLEAAAEDGAWSAILPFDGFRPPEWVPGGNFLTWHRLEGLDGNPPLRLRLRLVRQRDGAVLPQPGAPDGWQTVSLVGPFSRQ